MEIKGERGERRRKRERERERERSAKVKSKIKISERKYNNSKCNVVIIEWVKYFCR
jgi:hypothetical protein